MVAATNRPRLMAIPAVHIAALQKQGQAAAGPVNAGKGDDFTD